MKKYIVFLGLFSFLNTSIKAQGFNKLFYFDTCHTTVVSMKVFNNKIYVGGYMRDFTNYWDGFQSFVAKFDLNGKKIKEIRLRDNKYWRWVLEANIQVSKSGNLTIVSIVQDTTPISHASMIIQQIDTNLNIINSIIIDTTVNFSYFFANDTKLDDKENLYITGHIINEQDAIPYAKTYLIKVDSSLAFKVFNIFNFYQLQNDGTTIIIKNDSILINSILNDMMYISQPDCQIHSMSVYLKCDTNCNLVNYVNLKDSNLYSYSIEKTDGGYFASGGLITKRKCGFNNWGSATAFKLDTNFNIVWKRPYGDTINGIGYVQLKKVPNETNFITVSSNLVGDSIQNLNWNGLIVKYDDEGKLIWGKQYRGYTDITRCDTCTYEEQNQIVDFDFLPDGSIIACGNVMMHEPDSVILQGWILRLRPDGCLNDNDCGVNGIENKPNLGQESKKQLIEIYPNPTTDIVTINIDGNTEYPFKMNIFDIVGNKVKSILLTKNAEIISCKDLPQGSYIAVFSQQQKVMGVSKFVKLK